MKRLILIAACLLRSAWADNSVTITIGTKTWSFTLPVAITGLTCDKTALAIGESSTCTITLDSPAPAGGFTVTPYSAESPLVMSPAALVVPANAMAATFTVTRPVKLAGSRQREVSLDSLASARDARAINPRR